MNHLEYVLRENLAEALKDSKFFFEKSLIKLSDAKWVTDAIQDDYLYKWSADTPVFISSQTGTGKNTFIEEKIIPEVMRRKEKILILSNRIALSRQIKYRIAGIVDEYCTKHDPHNRKLLYQREIEKYSPLGLDSFETFGPITIRSYQSFLSKCNREDATEYAFVIVDECHFFLADATFNKYTDCILQSIVHRYCNSIRVYMSATLNEVVPLIIKEEHKIKKEKHDDLNPMQIVYSQDDSFIPLNRVKKRCLPYKFQYTYKCLGTDESEECYIEGYESNIIPDDVYVQTYNYFDKSYESYNSYLAVIYELERDYRYLQCKCLANLSMDETTEDGASSENPIQAERGKDGLGIYSGLVHYIKEQLQTEIEQKIPLAKQEKWIIFLSNKTQGKMLNEALGEEVSVFINADSKRHREAFDGRVYENIVSYGKFDKKVLITTSVLDNGININDSMVKHIVIGFLDKVSMLQCLGRVRTDRNRQGAVTVYLRNYSLSEINGKIKAARESLHDILQFEQSRQCESENVINEHFNGDVIFRCNVEGLADAVSYNALAKVKLKLDLKLLKNLMKQIKADEAIVQEKDGYHRLLNQYSGVKMDLEDMLGYDEYLNIYKLQQYSESLKNRKIDKEQRERYKQRICDIKNRLLTCSGEYASYRMQLQWLDRIDCVDCGNKEDFRLLQKEKDAFGSFLDQWSYKEEICPEKNFWLEHGMEKGKQEEFSKEFYERYIKVFGKRKEDKKGVDKYSLKVINQCLLERRFSYELLSHSFRLTDQEKEKFSAFQNSVTFWILAFRQA